MLYTKVETPSASTVSRDVKEVYQVSEKKITAYLQAQLAAIHVVFNG